MAHNTPRANLEFKKTFCETNLRYIMGYPNSEEKTRLANNMRREIEEADKAIQEMKDGRD